MGWLWAHFFPQIYRYPLELTFYYQGIKIQERSCSAQQKLHMQDTFEYEQSKWSADKLGLRQKRFFFLLKKSSLQQSTPSMLK